MQVGTIIAAFLIEQIIHTDFSESMFTYLIHTALNR